MQSHIDMTQMFNMIYRWPSFGGLQNTLGLRISWETSAIFSPVPGGSLLPRCPREVWEKVGERVSLGDVTSQEQRTPRAEAIFCGSVSIVAVVGAAIVRDVYSPVEGELSLKVGLSHEWLVYKSWFAFFALELPNSLPLLIATIRVVDHTLNNPNIFPNLSFLHVIIL